MTAAPRRIQPGSHAPIRKPLDYDLVDELPKVWCRTCHDWATLNAAGVCLWCIDAREAKRAAKRHSFDWAAAKRLRAEGMSYKAIGNRFGVTHGAVRYAIGQLEKHAA